MTHIRYDIIPQSGGWSIAMGGAVGPPYPSFDEALRDTEHVARFLSESGDSVEIIVWKGKAPYVLERIAPKLQPIRQEPVRPRSARARPVE